VRSGARRGLVAVLIFAACASAAARANVPPLERGDAAWTRCADGQATRARPEPIRAALEGYRAAVAAAPESLEAHWKLQRALWFAGDFASADPAAERASYERGIAAAERAFDVLAARVGGRAALDAATPESLRALVPARDAHDAASLYSGPR
jgi:hypothetical protein